MDLRHNAEAELARLEVIKLALAIFVALTAMAAGVVLSAHRFGLVWANAFGLILLCLLGWYLAGTVVSQRESEQAARERDRQYTQLFEQAPVGYHEVDRAGRIVRVNQTELDLLGYSKEEMIGRPFWHFVVEKEEAEQTFLARLTEAGSAIACFERTRIRKDGSSFASRSQSRALLDETGQIVGFRTTIQDVSEHKRMQTAALQARKGEAVMVLAGGIAHDFNNLLSIVYGYLNLAQMELEDRNLDVTLLQKAEQGLLDAKELTSKMIQLTGGAGSGKIPVAIDQELEKWVSEVAQRYGTAVQFNFLQTVRNVSVDREQMRQAIQNVVINAVEAMSNGGILQVEAANLSFSQPDDFPELSLPPGDYVLLTIRDEGQGIAEDILPKIFDPYFSTKERGVQKGLGLAVTAAVIRRHGGTFAVETKMGFGTSFHVYLPATES